MNWCPKCHSGAIRGPLYERCYGERLRYTCLRCGYDTTTPTKDSQVGSAPDSISAVMRAQDEKAFTHLLTEYGNEPTPERYIAVKAAHDRLVGRAPEPASVPNPKTLSTLDAQGRYLHIPPEADLRPSAPEPASAEKKK